MIWYVYFTLLCISARSQVVWRNLQYQVDLEVEAGCCAHAPHKTLLLGIRSASDSGQIPRDPQPCPSMRRDASCNGPHSSNVFQAFAYGSNFGAAADFV